MKKAFFAALLVVLLAFSGCAAEQNAQVVATTKPVYDLTVALCQGTGLRVDRLVTENLSCLHDYTLQVRQMRAIEAAQTVVLSGAGLEEFLEDALAGAKNTVDASAGIELLCSEEDPAHDHSHDHDHDGHHHTQDPHIWLSIKNARAMAQNICAGLSEQYPSCAQKLSENLQVLDRRFTELEDYGRAALSELSCRQIVTFHDGFAYFAQEWDLEILRAVEEESGSEASAAELKELIALVREHSLPAIFVEENGSTSASGIVARDTGVRVGKLTMCMAEQDYFEAMRQNIDAIKEALQ